MTVSQFQSGKRQRTQRGVSLIEVLVVLVILVTGILTIIRLFPSGFFSIQSTGNAALANTLGGAAINLGQQNAQSLPEAILPDDLLSDDLLSASMSASAYSNYDPDDPNNLENARVVTNETVTIPTLVKGQSAYPVNYGPVLMPKDPSTDATQLPKYFTVNSPNWTAQAGSYAPAPVAGSTPTPTDQPQDLLVPGQERFLVDLASKRIAVPYAAYTADPGATPFTLGNGTSVSQSTSFSQQMVIGITCKNDPKLYTVYLNVPAATHRDSTQPFAPQYVPNASVGDMSLAYLPDTTSNYQGGWFDPIATYQDTTQNSASGVSPPSNEDWVSVTLYRPYNGLALMTANGTAISFNNDPYEFQLLAGNIGGGNANLGVVSFNPKAATGAGAQARKAQISYIVYSWSILHEDHDVPSLTGKGSTFAARTTVPNLLLAGSANPDNSINPGIAGSSSSVIILDLGSGQFVAPFSQPFDPTTPDKPINNEDLNGTMSDPSLINVSYSLGRLTFGSDAFGDNPNGTGTAPAHRIRIFYTADLNWAVAVQKAPAYFSQVTPSGAVTGTTPLGASQFAYDSASASVYFPRCDAGKTVEIDGTYTTTGSNPTTQGFSDTLAVSEVLNTVGDSNVSVNLNDPNSFEHPVPAGATVVFSAVRGLSARSVVAWKERNVYKVHSVDTILNRTP